MQLIFTLVILVLGSSVYAQNENSSLVHCASKVYLGVTISNVPEAPALTCDQVLKYAEFTLLKARTISPLEFSSPYLIVYNNNSGSYYNWATGTVHWKMSQETINKDLGSLAHELGHVVFSEYLRSEREEFSKVLDAHGKYYEAVKKCLMEQINVTKPQSCELLEAQTEINAIISLGSPDFANYLSVEKAYNELFAAVFQILLFEDTTLLILYLQDREMNEQIASDPHYRLTPEVRMAIWNNWVRPLWHDKKAIINSLMKIFLADISANYVADVQLAPLELSTVESARMIKALAK